MVINMKKYGMVRRMVAAAIVTAFGCLAACAKETPEEENQVVVEHSNDKLEYNFVTAEIGDVTVTKTVNCTYRQQKDQEMCFALTGRLVDRVYVQEGDQVRQGQLLAELSARDLEEQIEDLQYYIDRNEILLKHADVNENLDISHTWVNFLYNHFMDEEGLGKTLDNIKKNYRYSREDCQDALELDRAKLEKLQQELTGCRLYAQMGGTVYKVKKDLEGSTSKANEVVVTIMDNRLCLFEMESPEYADYFPEGVTVTMKISGGSTAGEYLLEPYDRKRWGEIQQFTVLDGPSVSEIEVGTKGTIKFVTENRSQVLCVPEGTLYQADEKYYVYVMDEDNMRQIRWVEVGLVGDDSVEILSGLEQGERVIRR